MLPERTDDAVPLLSLFFVPKISNGDVARP